MRSLGKISGAAACCGMLRHAAACCGMLRHAAACFSLHLWVPTLLCQVELTCKRQHAQHCWAKLITFTIRIVCSGFVDIHHSQMAQSVVAHMQTVLCLDVAHQTERSLDMASRAWSSDKENSNATQHRKIVFFGMPPCHSGCSRIRQRARGWQSNIPDPLRLWHIGYVFTQLRIRHHFFGLQQFWVETINCRLSLASPFDSLCMQIIHLAGHHCGCLLQNLALNSSLWSWTCTEQFLHARGKLPTSDQFHQQKRPRSGPASE